MALRISYDCPTQITCEAAHCIIRNARVEKEKAQYNMTADGESEEIHPASITVQFSGLIYASEDAYLGDASPVGGFNFNFPMNNNAGATQHNILKQSYLHLKTQEGFDAGEDC